MASVRRKPVRRDAKSNKSDKEKKRKEKEPIMHDLEIITACWEKIMKLHRKEERIISAISISVW